MLKLFRFFKNPFMCKCKHWQVQHVMGGKCLCCKCKKFRSQGI